MVADGDARVLSHLSCFSCTWLPLPPSEHPISFTFFMLFSKPYLASMHISQKPRQPVIKRCVVGVFLCLETSIFMASQARRLNECDFHL